MGYVRYNILGIIIYSAQSASHQNLWKMTDIFIYSPGQQFNSQYVLTSLYTAIDLSLSLLLLYDVLYTTLYVHNMQYIVYFVLPMYCRKICTLYSRMYGRVYHPTKEGVRSTYKEYSFYFIFDKNHCCILSAAPVLLLLLRSLTTATTLILSVLSNTVRVWLLRLQRHAHTSEHQRRVNITYCMAEHIVTLRYLIHT